MKIDTNDYLTAKQAADELGAPKRALYRAIARAKEAGHECTAEVLGKTFVKRSSLAVLKQFYFPYYSEQHQAMVKQWGAAGGAAKRDNLRKASRSRGSS